VIAVVSLSLLTACAPTRYPPGHHSPSPSASDVNTLYLGEGGKVKRGNPYQIDGLWYYPLNSGESYDETGVASWYGEKFHGIKTANGETYNMYAMTAAHTTLPMPSIVQVTNLENGTSIRVRVNDRGPFVKSRLIDLSYAAAKALGVIKHGTAKVRVQTLHTPNQAVLSQVGIRAEQPYVQIGAFGDKSNARGVMQQVNQRYEKASPKLHIQDAAGVYRVRIGPLASLQQAENVLRDVQGFGYAAAMIIHD